MKERSYIIGIAGRTGSGKSTIAERLAQKFPEEVVVISMDNYYKDQAGLEMSEKEKVNYDHPDSLDIELLIKHLKELLAGKSVTIPTYSFEHHTRASEVIEIDPVKIIIVEGILAFVNKELFELFAMTIFVDTDERICYDRREARDVEERGRTAESVKHQYKTTVLPMDIEFVQPTKQFASHVVSGEGNIQEVVDILVDEIVRNT